MIGAFFDVVGTVYRGAFWRDISERQREQKRNRFWIWAYLIWHMAGWPLNLAGLLSKRRWYESWARDMAWSPQQLLDSIASRLDIEHVMGTPLEVDRGRYTGKMSGSVTMNEGKAAAMQRWANHNRLDIDWSSSYAYGDGGGDAHMLEMVGHPVAVYPDESLKAVAEQRGWQIIGEREPRT